MYKNLLIALLLVAFAPVAAHSADPTSPVIVAKRRLLNQTAPIPMTTIFTPAHDGVYRLSVYATITIPANGSNAYWLYNLAWTDDAGLETTNNILYGYGSSVGQFVNFFGQSVGGAVAIVEAKAGNPIAFNMTQGNGTDNSTYNLYYTLEQIE